MRAVLRILPALLLAVAARAHDRPALVTVSVSEDHAVDGGKWYSMLKRTGTPWTCSNKQEELQCVEHSLVVDNQSPQTVREWAAKARALRPALEIEATGGITLGNVRAYAEAGVDFVSVGALTHSVRAADLGIEVRV